MTVAVSWNPITWIVNTLVTPVINLLVGLIQPIVELLIEAIGAMIMALFADYLFDALLGLLGIIRFLQNAFNVFAGAHPVGTLQADQTYDWDSFLLQALVNQMGLVGIYWAFCLVSLVLTAMFTIMAILRSMGSIEYNPQNSVGRIMGRLGKTMLTFLIIPAMMIFGINLASHLTTSVNSLFYTHVSSQDENASQPTIDRIIFLATTMNAAQDPAFNGDNASFTDALRNPYFIGTKDYAAQGSPITPRHEVSRNDFHLYEADFLTGFVLAIFMIFILFGAILFAVRRILDVLLLFIAAPFFVAVIPLDEGKKFGAWRDMFVAKILSAYGLIIMMALYLNATPIIVGSALVLDPNGFINSLLKLLLLLGGAFALKNSHSVLLEIINPVAAQHAQQSVLGGLGVGAFIGAKAMGGVMGAIKGGGGGQAGGNVQANTGGASAAPPAGGTAPASDAGGAQAAGGAGNPQQFTG